VALLEQPGAFEKEAPAALASELAGALLDMAAELRTGEARAKAAESAARAAEARATQAERRLENIKRDLETGDPDRSVIALRKSLKQHLPQ
jgi:formiminotetrahydrofolate cyclodeaminase